MVLIHHIFFLGTLLCNSTEKRGKTKYRKKKKKKNPLEHQTMQNRNMYKFYKFRFQNHQH